MKEASIDINPLFKGMITAKDLLFSEGTLSFSTNSQSISSSNGFLFTVVSDNFIFASSIQNRSIVMQRNEVVSTVTLEEYLGLSSPIQVFLSWTFTKLIIDCGVSADKRKRIEIPTKPEAPPVALIKWARAQLLIPKLKYESYEQLRERVYESLLQINDKLLEADAFQSFWNIEYDGKKIINRLPKKEPDIQPLIHCILSDQMLLSGIDIIRESKTGAGLLDFTMQGFVDNIGICSVCVELKLAHSQDLVNGVLSQLPKYMRAMSAEYGAYCILNYKGEWFDEPNLPSGDKIDIYLSKAINGSDDPIVKSNIRVIIINLSKPSTASR